MQFSFLTRRRHSTSLPEVPRALQVDVHAQLLPGRHDGADSVEHSVSLLRELATIGIRKVVATLHIMNGFYTNTAESIIAAASLVNYQLQQEQVKMEVIPAAEYYVDNGLTELLSSKSRLLTFGKNYFLFDTALVTAPLELEATIRSIRQRGLTPVMAHPEQYVYLQRSPDLIWSLHRQGVLFQINLTSLAGQPTREARRLAEWMVEQHLVSFIGSNLHHERQLPLIKQAIALPCYHKALELGVLNNSL